MCLIYLPLFAEYLGATHTQIGVIGAVYGISLFFSSYLFGRVADLYPPKKVLYAGFASSSVFFLLQAFATTPFNLALIRALAGFSTGMFPAALISYVYTLRKDISKFSSFGALGWTVGTLTAGVIADLRGIFLASSLFFLAALLLLFHLPEASSPRQRSEPFSLDIVKKNWSVYSTYFARHTGACSVWIIFPLYLKSLGAQELEIGLLYAINPLSQFFLMQHLKTRNSERLVKIGHLASTIAFTSLLFITSYYQVAFVMFAIAVSWSFLYVGSVVTLLKHNTSKGTAVGLLTSVISIAAVAGSFIGGGLSDAASSFFLSQAQGYRAVFVFSALLSALGFVFYRSSYSQK
jgi:MFS family permease